MSDLAALLSNSYMVPFATAEEYVDTARSVCADHRFVGSSGLDDGVQRVMVMHRFATLRYESHVQNVLRDHRGSYHALPVAKLVSDTETGDISLEQELDEEYHVEVDYDCDVFGSYNASTYSADEAGLEGRLVEATAKSLFHEGINEDVLNAYAFALGNETTVPGLSLIADVVDDALQRSVHHVGGVPLMEDIDQDGFDQYLAEQVRFDDGLGGRYTVDRVEDSGVDHAYAAFCRAAWSPASPLFRNCLLNSDRVLPVLEACEEGSRAYEAARRRVAYNEVDRHGGKQSAIRHRESELSNLDDVPDGLAVFGDRHRIILDAVEAYGDEAHPDRLIPFKP